MVRVTKTKEELTPNVMKTLRTGNNMDLTQLVVTKSAFPNMARTKRHITLRVIATLESLRMEHRAEHPLASRVVARLEVFRAKSALISLTPPAVALEDVCLAQSLVASVREASVVMRVAVNFVVAFVVVTRRTVLIHLAVGCVTCLPA